MNNRDEIFRDVRSAPPPAELRERVLRAAQQVGREVALAAPRWWGLRRFDLAWLAALVLLIAAHVALSLSAGSSASPPQMAVRTGTVPHELVAAGVTSRMWTLDEGGGGGGTGRRELERVLRGM
jgi:hypothetical protein